MQFKNPMLLLKSIFDINIIVLILSNRTNGCRELAGYLVFLRFHRVRSVNGSTRMEKSSISIVFHCNLYKIINYFNMHNK